MAAILTPNGVANSSIVGTLALTHRGSPYALYLDTQSGCFLSVVCQAFIAIAS